MTVELFREDAYRRTCTATVQAHVEIDGQPGVVLDQTVFYVEGGGQPGDSGTIRWQDGAAPVPGTVKEAAVLGTVKDRASGQRVHVLEGGASLPPVGATVEAAIDWDRRHRHMRMHTALHLLCSLIEAPVTGGSVSAEKGRLDFDLDSSPEKDDLTQRLNALVAANHPVTASWISGETLMGNPDIVRTMSVKPPITPDGVRVIRIGAPEGGVAVDYQPCGGTHVQATAEIGALVVSKIEKKGRLNRRIVIEFA